MANIANLITKLSGIIASLDDIRDAISQGGGGSSTASRVSVTPTSPLTGTNLQATTNETAALLQDHTNEISALNSRIDIIGERVHSEGYTPYTVQNTGIINQITIPENGTYLFTAYIRGAGCWFVKNGAFFPDLGGLVVEPDSTSYSAIWVLNAGDVITQANHTGSAQTYTASEMSAIRLK